jgi:hypothetical protein
VPGGCTSPDVGDSPSDLVRRWREPPQRVTREQQPHGNGLPHESAPDNSPSTRLVRRRVNGSRIVLTSDYGDETTDTVRDGEVSIRMAIAGEPTIPYVFGK